MLNTFDNDAAVIRCRRYRRRILDISQQVSALHIGSAFSCTEIVDCIYNGLMKQGDIFLMSKGHGCMIQYAILEERGVLSPDDLAAYCTRDGRLGVHPDIETPGIVAATGSLGHGLSMAVGMALAERASGATIYVILSDGELMEGSTFEAILMASSLRLSNIVAIVDYNNLQSLGRTNETHPTFYPLVEKFQAFGWGALEVSGHYGSEIFDAVNYHRYRYTDYPLVIVARTIKGRGISFMEGIPSWHYRSPDKLEYAKAIAELEA